MIIGYVLDDSLDRSDGVQQAMITIGEEMRRRGHEVHYLVTSTDRKDIKNIHSLAMSITLPFNGNSTRTPFYASTKKIKELFSMVRFDVLHIQMPYSPVFAAKVIKLAPKNCSIIGTFHILPYRWMNILGLKALRFLQMNTHKHIHDAFAVSKPAAEFMKCAYGLTGRVIPNPIKPVTVNTKNKKVHFSKKQIVFLGRFEKRKGIMQLLEAYGLLLPGTRPELTMAGAGPLLNKAKLYSDKHKLAVRFPGFVSEKEKYELLATADIAIFPSLSGESFGIVLLEAMSAGSGVVLGGNNPGYASVLSSVPEALFDPSRPQQTANTITKYLNDRGAYEALNAAQRKLLKSFKIDVVADDLESIYKKKLAELCKSGKL